MHTPSCSRTVAYRELARGHDCRLQKPVRLYSFRQKFCVTVLGRPVELHVEKDTRNNILDFVRAELVTDGGPYHVVALHGKAVQVGATIRQRRDNFFRSRVPYVLALYHVPSCSSPSPLSVLSSISPGFPHHSYAG